MQRIIYGVRKRDFQKTYLLVFMSVHRQNEKEHENSLYEKIKINKYNKLYGKTYLTKNKYFECYFRFLRR